MKFTGDNLDDIDEFLEHRYWLSSDGASLYIDEFPRPREAVYYVGDDVPFNPLDGERFDEE